jgi:hypothetical protein
MKTRGKGRAYNWSFKSKLPKGKDSLGDTEMAGYEMDNRPKEKVRRPKKGC